MIKVFAEKDNRSWTKESAFKLASYEGKLVCINRRLFRFHHASVSGQCADAAFLVSSSFLAGLHAEKNAAQQMKPTKRMSFCIPFLFSGMYQNYRCTAQKIFDARYFQATP